MHQHWKPSPAAPTQPPPAQPSLILPHCLRTHWQPQSLVLHRVRRTHESIHKCISNDRVSQRTTEPVTQTQLSRKARGQKPPVHGPRRRDRAVRPPPSSAKASLRRGPLRPHTGGRLPSKRHCEPIHTHARTQKSNAERAQTSPSQRALMGQRLTTTNGPHEAYVGTREPVQADVKRHSPVNTMSTVT